MIVACSKWVDRRPSVDPLTGAVGTDPRSSGASEADEAALEWALRVGSAWGEEVLSVAAGPVAVEPMLRDALAAGASRGLRVPVELDDPSDAVAGAVGAALRARPGVGLVVCGAWSLDRGSGAFPAFLAAELDAAQALGLVGVEIEGDAGGEGLRAERRLDAGRRERLRIRPPAVISVEPSTARLRRAGLDAALTAQHAPIEVSPARPAPAPGHQSRVRVGPFRPRARALAPPAGADARSRVLELTGAASTRSASRTVALDPPHAAEAILEQLRAWGYID